MLEPVSASYKAVLDDLEGRKAPLLAQIEELDRLIENIYKVMPAGMVHHIQTQLKPVPHQCFKNMSMRWGILQYLSDFVKNPLPTSEIAAGLVQGGFATSPTLNSKVSAILSQMAGKDEVQKDGQEWRISTHGREMWESIQKSEKYLNRHNLGADVDLD